MEIVVVIMGQDCERTIKMALESVKNADKIIFCSGTSPGRTDDGSMKIARDSDAEIIRNTYYQDYKGMNGKQRNFYLDYIKEKCPDWWCLAIDADEVVEDFDKIKKFIQTAENGIYSIKMRHLIGDLAHEDSTINTHFAPNRLFKISEAEKYPEIEHPVLQGKVIGSTDCTTIWHLAYIPNMWEMKRRYDNHMEKSNIHTPEYLKNWYWAHIFGRYPKKEFNPVELPKIILNEFGIDRDEIYFQNRGLEVKHFTDAIHWKDFFKCQTAWEFGCGKGPRIYALNNIGVDAWGLEISEFACTNGFSKKIINNDITLKAYFNKTDLVIAYDLLEHLEYSKLDIAIENIINTSKKHILISVPFRGTQNCENDSTHIIKENKEWWIKQFTDQGLKILPTPEHFLFKEQILIFER